MRYKPIILALLLFAPGLVAAAKVTPSFPVWEGVYFNFDKPKGSVNTFSAEEVLILKNPSNATVDFHHLSVSVEGVSGISIGPDFIDTLTVLPLSDAKIPLTFRAESTMEAGRYHNGTLNVSGENVIAKSIPITIEIHHPPPTINATWDPVDLGNVKAGSKLSYTLIVREVMGYKPLEDLSVNIYGLGPVENVTYNGTLGYLEPLDFRDVAVNFSVPKRDLRPGSYSIVPVIASSNIVPNANMDELKYSIPIPKIQINPAEIDFGKITFEAGKDTKTAVLNVSETGGFTPIEKLSISLVKGEEGWITHSKRDYIAAGKSRKYAFRIFLPADASLGLKSWDFKLNTLYAGSKDIHAKVIVSFPGTDEAIAFLKNTSSATNSAQENSLIQNTILLLETSKGKTQLRKIAMVMSVYSGTRTFLSNLGTAVGSEDQVEAGDAIIRAKAALNKMQIGNQNLKDSELKRYSRKSVSSAKEIWESEARNMITSLEKSAETKKDSNYKLTALYYNRIGKIYTLLDDPQNAAKYSEKQESIEKLYRDSLLKAGDMNRVADSELDSARGQTFRLGEDTYLVLNPFSYDFVSGTYEEVIKKYEQAAALYRGAGEDSDADLLESELEKIIGQKNNVSRTFLVYGSFLGLIFLWFIGRVVWGLQRYTQDEMDGHGGDVIAGKEAEAVGGFQTWSTLLGEAMTGKKAEGIHDEMKERPK